MSVDAYQVKVIHQIHPHLIWVEVNSSKDSRNIVFEQIGIYGIIPLETTIDVEHNKLDIHKPNKWTPAATNLLKKFVTDKGLWFSPTYIDRRVSIFDDNIHKYGEILIQQNDGKLKKLSKKLVKSGFAYYDEGVFHKNLSSGVFKTRLENHEIKEVIAQFERYYKLKNLPKSYWESSLWKQMSVYKAAVQIESTLTESNLEKHNNLMLNKIIKDKMKDLDLCKDVEEESLGRAYGKPKEPKSKLLQKLLRSQNKISDNVQTYNDIKKFLDNNSKKEVNCSQESRHNVKEDSNMKNYKEFENEVSEEVIKNEDKNARIEMQAQVKLDKVTVTETHNTNFKEELETSQPHLVQEQESYTSSKKDINNKSNIFKRRMKIQEIINEKRIAFGPPGLNHLHYKVQALVQEPDKPIKQIPAKVEENQCIIRNGELDSEINLNISNKDILKDILDAEMKSKIIKESPEKQDNKCSDASSSHSSLLQKRLRMFNNKSKTIHNSSSSDTSIKDSSTSEDVRKNYESDEGITEIIDRLDKEYNFSKEKIDVKETKDLALKTEKHSKNPFQNVDSSISGFVNKLATPVLMVHSKSNKLIEPSLTMRDIPFNTDIHIALRNMNIKAPMMLQSISWYTVLRGHSLFLISPPSSGKTLGYLPAVCRLVNDYSDDIESVGPIAIIVCATARSVSYVERMAKIFLGLHGRVVSCYAGVDDFDITTRLLNGCDLLISTPSALVRLMQMDDFGVDLRRLCTFVIDDCERVSSVYNDEIHVFVYKIRQMLKNRAHKELKVQYIFVSTVWHSFMESFAKKAPDTVVCIGAFQECVLYSKANTSVVFVKNEKKLSTIHEFLKQVDTSKKTVIVCRSDDEVDLLKKDLKKSNYVVFACNNEMTVNELQNLNIAWNDYEEPIQGPILVCCDGNLTHMNVTDAHNLIHYSLPPLFSMFCKRFAVLNDNYPSIFNTENETVKIKILLEETNIEQLPKIINFVKRCTDNVPVVFDAICTKVLLEKDIAKAKSCVSLCSLLLSLGHCPDFYNCQKRHTILKEYDTPLEWMPKNGMISFKILHCFSPDHFSVKLLTHNANGVRNKFPDTYSSLSIKLGMYYSKESNRQLHGIPKIGDICTVMLKRDLFVRCQVVKILSFYPRGNPNVVQVFLLDEKKIEKTCDVYLYHLPDDMKSIQTYTVQVRLANIQPKDKDITYSDLATNLVKKIVDSEDDLYVRGRVSLTLKECIFVDTLEACNDLKSLDNSTVVRHNIKQELLDKHALNNSKHISKIKELCSEIPSIGETSEDSAVKHPKIKLKGSWSHLGGDDISSVFFASAIDPDTLFIRLVKFESCLADLLKEIQKYAENVEPLNEVDIGDIVIAKFPDDCMFERARVDEINDTKIKCFFVDQGDWRDVFLKDIIPSTEQFVNKLPFQAIECRLVSVKPPGEKWSEFAINWLSDNCFDKSNNLKHLYVKYFTKEPAKFTDGHKYGVTLTDTYGEQDVVINQQMINLNLASINEAELEYINNMSMQTSTKTVLSSGDDDWEKITVNSNISDDKLEDSFDVLLQRPLTSTSPNLLKQPIRSAPLIGSDDESEDFDKWDINMAEEFKGMLKPLAQSTSEYPNLSPPANKSITYKVHDAVEAAVDNKFAENSNSSQLALKTAFTETNGDTEIVVKNGPENQNSLPQALKLLTCTETPNCQEIQNSLPQFAKTSTDTKVVVSGTELSQHEVHDISERPTKVKALDSDDLTSPETSDSPDQGNIKQDNQLINRPKLIWRQSKKDVIIKIHLIGADYKLDIKEKSLDFRASANGTEYGFNFELYGVINLSKCSHENKGQYILVKLFKALQKNWLTLTKDPKVKKWITYDIDYIDTSSDEESVEPVQPMIYEDSDSDTEVEESFDDVA